MGLFLLTLAVIGAAMLVMAVGVLFNYPCLRGSCGGLEVFGRDGESLSCAACPHRKKGRESFSHIDSPGLWDYSAE